MSAGTITNIGVLGILSVLLTVTVWLVAARYFPPRFDGAETALLFFVCLVAVSLVAAVWRRIAARKRV